MEKGGKTLFVGAAAVVVLAGLGAWLFIAKAPAPESVVVAPPAPAEPAPAAVPPPPAAPAEPLPALEDSDAWARARASGLSGSAVFAAWLKNDSLLQRWAAAVDIVAAGRAPADALSFLRPRRKFVPIEEDGRYFLDPRSYARYDAAADAFSSIDPKAAGAFFAAARPLIDRAWASMGEGRGGVVDGVARAARELLAAPLLPDRAELRPSEKGIVFRFVDDALERRSLAQKQLMRMGPRNQRKVREQVRALALAVGVPEASLR